MSVAIKEMGENAQIVHLGDFFDTTTIKTPVGFCRFGAIPFKIKSRLVWQIYLLSAEVNTLTVAFAATVGQIQLSPSIQLTNLQQQLYRNFRS
jgi:hypothetical protein